MSTAERSECTKGARVVSLVKEYDQPQWCAGSGWGEARVELNTFAFPAMPAQGEYPATAGWMVPLVVAVDGASGTGWVPGSWR